RRLDHGSDATALLALEQIREDVDHRRVPGPADLLDRRNPSARILVLEAKPCDDLPQRRAQRVVDADARHVASPRNADLLTGRCVEEPVAAIDARGNHDATSVPDRVELAVEQRAEHGLRAWMARARDRGGGPLLLRIAFGRRELRQCRGEGRIRRTRYWTEHERDDQADRANDRPRCRPAAA